MERKSLTSILLLAGVLILFANPVWSDVPPPPANQSIGLLDGVFNNLEEAECRICHDDPNVAGDPDNVTRHHLLYGQEIPPNSVVPNPDASPNGTYTCLSCHREGTPEECGGVICFIVERDCLECHVQIPGEASVHHLTDAAQGKLPPAEDQGTLGVGDCVICHGSLVKDIGTATIPTYNPSLVTPATSGGDGDPSNIYGNGAGACDYCHDFDGLPPADRLIWSNFDTHHNTGVFIDSETGETDDSRCQWCHGTINVLDIRVCEECHDYETLHNIQADSDGDGTIIIGGELAGYGHVGRDAGPGDSDCWGCHGFAFPAASAPASGPLAPYISSSNIKVMTAGSDTAITLTGAAFTNISGTVEWTSSVLLTSAAYVQELTPDSMSEGSMTVTIPGSTPAGSYTLMAVKDDQVQSNPVVLSIIPAVAITGIDCSEDTLTITGTGFGDAPPASAEEYINAKVGGMKAEIISWTDTEIVAAVPFCSDAVTVNALFGSPTTCDCEGNFDGDQDTDGTDIHTFKMDFGRNQLQLPCADGSMCNGDFDCDQDVDGSDAFKMKEDFGRSSLGNPCAPVSVEQWCAY